MESNWVEAALGKRQNSYYGFKFFNEEKTRAVERASSADDYEKQKRLDKLRKMGML